MMMRAGLLFGIVAALACLPTPALADWEEDFDSYQNGSGLHGQGGWKGWDNDPTFDAFVSDLYARSNPHSVEITPTTDIVHEYSGYDTSGRFTYTAWQYIPTDFQGLQYFILLNTYADGGPNNWSTQVRFDSGLGVVESEAEGAQLPLITGDWVQVRTEIDLDLDIQEIYYGGRLLTTKSWTDGVSGDGDLNINAVDLYAHQLPTAIYYDDLSLRQRCPGDIDGDGDSDHSDLGALLAAWCTQAGDPNWNPNADLDGDGHVGHGDLGILLSDWNCGTGVWGITGVDPLSGEEGDLITISGHGFGWNEMDWNVFVAGLGARAHVIDASPTQLTCQIRPVPLVQSGDVLVVRGTGTTLPGGTYQSGNVFGTVASFYRFVGNPGDEQAAGVVFQLPTASPNTDRFTDGPAAGGGLSGQIGGPVDHCGTVKVDLHIKVQEGEELFWIEMVFNLHITTEPPGGVASPQQVADQLAQAINDAYGEMGVGATTDGTGGLRISHPGYQTGWGSVGRPR